MEIDTEIENDAGPVDKTRTDGFAAMAILVVAAILVVVAINALV